MVNSMLEHSKLILQKVSFDSQLFYKELLKAINWLNPEELPKFEKWCFSFFGNEHRDILTRAFSQIICA